jgi:hypothetical protein
MWFLSYLSEWPKEYEYWWAQYPYMLYPDKKLRSTWSTVMKRISEIKFFPAEAAARARAGCAR